MGMTDGDVLELGSGLFSTPYLHWVCFEKRKLVTYEDNKQFLNFLEGFKNDLHEIKQVTDWDKIEIEKPWDVVLVDHSPAPRRKEEIRRLANYAKFIVVHDTQDETEFEYQYHEIYPLFKYRFDYKKDPTNTSILSNFVDVSKLEI